MTMPRNYVLAHPPWQESLRTRLRRVVHLLLHVALPVAMVLGGAVVVDVLARWRLS